MKKLLTALLLIISCSSYSQLKNITILIGRTDQEVTHYFDSLNALNGHNFKVERNITDKGDLILKNDFPLSEENYYLSLAIIARFLRIDGIEKCVTQVIMGTVEYAELNLANIKDNFTQLSNNRWTQPYNEFFDLEVTFEKENAQTNYYLISYKLVKK